MTCGEKIESENSQLIVVYYLWKEEENHQRLRKKQKVFSRCHHMQKTKCLGWGELLRLEGRAGVSGAGCGRAGATDQHRRYSWSCSFSLLWEKIWKVKKEGIRNCYVLSWTPCKILYRNFIIWSLQGPRDMCVLGRTVVSDSYRLHGL